MTFQEEDYETRDADPYALAKFEIVKSWLPPAPCTILDAGSGNGFFAAELAKRGYAVTALDPNKKACAMAVGRKKRFGLKHMTVVQADFYKYTPKTKFDAVIALDVLEHVTSEREFVSHVARVLKPRGVWVLTVPALQVLYGRFDELLEHRERYDMGKIRRAAADTFSIKKMRYFGMSFIPLAVVTKLRKTTYPVEQGSKGLLGVAMRAVCALEREFPAPLGTSLLAKLQLR